MKDVYESNTDVNTQLIGNVDETPICLELITTTTLEKIGEKTIKIRTFGKTKQRITCLIWILANGMRLPPMLVFKGVPARTLEHRLNNLKLVIEKKYICSLPKKSMGW